LKVWKITEEFFHSKNENVVIGYFSARYSNDKIRLLLEQLAHIRYLSVAEQISCSKYNKPSKSPHVVLSGRRGETMTIGHEPFLVAKRCEIKEKDYLNFS